jgi:hypothetical protein
MNYIIKRMVRQNLKSKTTPVLIRTKHDMLRKKYNPHKVLCPIKGGDVLE